MHSRRGDLGELPADRSQHAGPRSLDTLGFRACVKREDGFAEGMILRLAEPLRCDFIRMNCGMAKAEFHESA